MYTTNWRPYQEWFRYFESHMLKEFKDYCQEEMNLPKSVDAWCQKGASCIYNHMSSFSQATLSGAAVMLGLTPATLALLGPSENSLAFLSTERPILSILLASSTATLSVGYPFSRISPLQPLNDALSNKVSVDRLLPWNLMDKPLFTSPIQYILAAGATVNTILVSWEIVRKSIVTWSCPNWAWVLCWSFVPLFVHVIGMIFFRLTVERTKGLERTISLQGEQPPPPTSTLARAWKWCLDQELRPCSQRVLPAYKVKWTLRSQLMWWTPRVLSYLQYLMGTAIFSALAFIPISDVFPIITRYGISAVVARCIVGLELSALARNNKMPGTDGQISPPLYASSFDSGVRRALTISEQLETRPVFGIRPKHVNHE